MVWNCELTRAPEHETAIVSAKCISYGGINFSIANSRNSVSNTAN